MSSVKQAAALALNGMNSFMKSATTVIQERGLTENPKIGAAFEKLGMIHAEAKTFAPEVLAPIAGKFLRAAAGCIVLFGDGALNKAAMGLKESLVPLITHVSGGPAPPVPEQEDKKSTLNMPLESAETALYIFAHGGDQRAVTHLLKQAGSREIQTRLVNAPVGGFGGTPVHAAASTNNLSILSMLLSHGADVSKAQLGGPKMTPLGAAAYAGHTGAVSVLLDVGADAKSVCGKDGATALHLAAKSGSRETCSVLLHAGASHETLDGQGRTPSDVALAQVSDKPKMIAVGPGATLAGTGGGGGDYKALAKALKTGAV